MREKIIIKSINDDTRSKGKHVGCVVKGKNTHPYEHIAWIVMYAVQKHSVHQLERKSINQKGQTYKKYLKKRNNT